MINNNVLSFSIRKNKKCHQKAQKTVLLCDQHFWWLPRNPWNHGSILIITPSHTSICRCNPSSGRNYKIAGSLPHIHVHVGLFSLVTNLLAKSIYYLFTISVLPLETRAFWISGLWRLRDTRLRSSLLKNVYLSHDFEPF